MPKYHIIESSEKVLVVKFPKKGIKLDSTREKKPQAEPIISSQELAILLQNEIINLPLNEINSYYTDPKSSIEKLTKKKFIKLRTLDKDKKEIILTKEGAEFLEEVKKLEEYDKYFPFVEKLFLKNIKKIRQEGVEKREHLLESKRKLSEEKERLKSQQCKTCIHFILYKHEIYGGEVGYCDAHDRSVKREQARYPWCHYEVKQ